MRLTSPAWSHVSAEAKQLVSAMLERRVDRRLTADEVLRHPWLASAMQAERARAEAPPSAGPRALLAPGALAAAVAGLGAPSASDRTTAEAEVEGVRRHGHRGMHATSEAMEAEVEAAEVAEVEAAAAAAVAEVEAEAEAEAAAAEAEAEAEHVPSFGPMPTTTEGLGVARDFVARVGDAGTMGEQLYRLAAGTRVPMMTRDQVVGSWAEVGGQVVGALWACRQVKSKSVDITIQRMVIDPRWRYKARPTARVRERLWDALWRQVMRDSGVPTTFSLASVECVLKYKSMWIELFGAAARAWEGSEEHWGYDDTRGKGKVDPPRLRLSI